MEDVAGDSLNGGTNVPSQAKHTTSYAITTEIFNVGYYLSIIL